VPLNIIGLPIRNNRDIQNAETKKADFKAGPDCDGRDKFSPHFRIVRLIARKSLLGELIPDGGNVHPVLIHIPIKNMTPSLFAFTLPRLAFSVPPGQEPIFTGGMPLVR
jgi:hypothetical protein